MLSTKYSELLHINSELQHARFLGCQIMYNKVVNEQKIWHLFYKY